MLPGIWMNFYLFENMRRQDQIIVTIRREGDSVFVSNGRGQEWEFRLTQKGDLDVSTSAAIAQIASSMLVGTISHQLYQTKSSQVKYTLSVEFG